MKWNKKIFFLLTTVPIVLSMVSCGWTINNKNDDIEKDKDEWKDRKFNYPVMPEWEDLNIVGQNEKEWIRLEEIYAKEIENGNKQLKEINQGLEENKNDPHFQDFYQMVDGLTKNMILWYQQINVEIELNLWLIDKNIDLKYFQLIKNQDYQQKIKQIISKITDLKYGFFIKWKTQFQQWFNWIKNKDYIKANNNQWLKDRDNWLRVEKHLEMKNIYFKNILKDLVMKDL